MAEDKFSNKGRGEILNRSLLPLSGTGNTVIEAVKVLVEHGVQPSVIILLSLFSTPHGELRGVRGTGAGTGTCNGELPQ